MANEKVISVKEFVHFYFESYHIDGPVEEYVQDTNLGDFPISLEIKFEGGEIFATSFVKSMRCANNLCSGFYQIHSNGDIDGFENRCDKCGSKVWGPIYWGQKCIKK